MSILGRANDGNDTLDGGGNDLLSLLITKAQLVHNNFDESKDGIPTINTAMPSDNQHFICRKV